MAQVRHVMLVRNDLLGLRLQESVLNRQAFQLHVASSEQEALTSVASSAPDAILIDKEGSGISLKDFCNAVRALPRASLCRLVLLDDTPDCPEAREFMKDGGAMVVPRADPERLALDLGKLLDVPVRATARVPLTAVVKLEVPELDLNAFKSMFANAVDINLHGMRLEAQHPLQPGSTLRLHFVLPGQSTRISVNALVRHEVDPQLLHYGMEFVEMGAESQVILEQYLRGRGAE